MKKTKIEIIAVYKNGLITEVVWTYDNRETANFEFEEMKENCEPNWFYYMREILEKK